MDEVGIWAQVLYPNVAGFGSQRFLSIRDDELKLVCVQRVQRLPARLGVGRRRAACSPIMSLPFWDIDETVKEITRNLDAGHRGILFTGEPQRFGLPYLAEAALGPAVGDRAGGGPPIHFHIGSGDMNASFGPERISALRHRGHLRVHVAPRCS